VNGSVLKLVCDLTIRLLRRDDPGIILSSRGDIDNRLKPVLDALHIPQSNQLPDMVKPESDEDPFFCLLEDDSLIGNLCIHTDKLHRRLHPHEHYSDVEITIDAVVRASEQSQELFW
jgi:hypothetical protein